MLVVGSIHAGRGERAAGHIPIADSANHSVAMPVILLAGADKGPTLLVTAGIHGGEHSGTQAALQFAHTVDPSDLKGNIIVLPVMNPQAFSARQFGVCPIDGKNMNRIFPGCRSGTISERTAFWLLEEISPLLTHFVDLHGGDVGEALSPFAIWRPSGDTSVDRISQAMAEGFGLPAVVALNPRGQAWTGDGTLLAALGAQRIPGIVAEAGELGCPSVASVGFLYRGLQGTLGMLGMTRRQEHGATTFDKYTGLAIVPSPCDGIQRPVVAIGEAVEKGRVIAKICDLLGADCCTVYSPRPGTVLFQTVSLSIRRGEPLVGLGVVEVDEGMRSPARAPDAAQLQRMCGYVEDDLDAGPETGLEGAGPSSGGILCGRCRV